MVLMKATYEVMYKSVCEMYPIEETRAMLVTVVLVALEAED
jgi:hypothetical protein